MLFDNDLHTLLINTSTTQYNNSMGGDGGVIASNRRYLRGAGTADTAGDATKQAAHKDPALVAQELQRDMVTCALTGQALDFASSQSIVACPYGKLYHKEAAIEALLRRKAHKPTDLGEHIQKLKDLNDVRFHTAAGKDGSLVPTCPVTEKELNGLIPAFLLLPGNPDRVNVLSERALVEMKDLIDEYGPVEQRIRLAPPESVLEQVKQELREQRHKSKDKKKKRKHHKEDDDEDRVVPQPKKANKLVEKTRAKVSAAIKKNEVLSSLFS